MKTQKTSFFSNLLAIGLIITVLSGCASSGMHMASTITNVQLTEANYRIVARSVSGEARAGYIFGGAVGAGMYVQVFAVARVTGERALYKAAMDNLWSNYETRHGSAEGKNLALVNIRYDIDILNLFFYTQPVLTIQADVVEFTN